MKTWVLVFGFFSLFLVPSVKAQEINVATLQEFQKRGIYYQVTGTIVATTVDAGNTGTLLPRNGGFRPFKGIRAQILLGQPTTNVIPVDYTFGKKPISENLHSKSVEILELARAQLSPAFAADCQKRLNFLGATAPRLPIVVYGCQVTTTMNAKLQVTFDLAKYRPMAHLAKQTLETINKKWQQFNKPVELASKTK